MTRQLSVSWQLTGRLPISGIAERHQRTVTRRSRLSRAGRTVTQLLLGGFGCRRGLVSWLGAGLAVGAVPVTEESAGRWTHL